MRPPSARKRRPLKILTGGWSWLNRQSRAVQVVLASLALVVALLPAYFARQQPEVPSDVTLIATPNQLVSSNGQGVPADRDSGRPALDRSGRFVAFTSAASNLADTGGGHYNVFVKDRDTGSIILASRAADGGLPNGESQFPTICSAGRWVAFASTSTNLLSAGPLLAQGVWRVYVYDTLAGTTQVVSVDKDGADPKADSRNPEFSADCSRVVFESTATSLTRDRAVADQYAVYVRDLRTRTTILASMPPNGDAADGSSTHAAISPDGKSVAFSSWATNLAANVGDREIPQVYVVDIESHLISVPSVIFTGGEDSTLRGFSWPDFSPDGHYLIFRSVTNSTDPSYRGKYVFVWDLVKHVSALTGLDGSPTRWSDACVSGVNNGTSFAPKISDASADHGYRVLFTVTGPQGSACQLVFRELTGPDIRVKPQQVGQEILEPALNDTGDVLSWAVAGSTQLVYACDVAHCSK